MACGRRGVHIALFIYLYCQHFVKLTSKASTTSSPIIEQGHEKLLSTFRISSYQTYGKNCDKTVYKLTCQRHTDNKVVILMGLLLAGDVHPCPGPTSRNASSATNVPRPSQAEPSMFECFRKKGLHCLHLNVRSLPPKIDELRLIAQSTNAAVIGVSETWLDETVNDSEIEIPNYNIQRMDRNRDGGGVCIYIRADLAYNPRMDLHHNDIESTWVDILLPKSKPILIGICYRPQTNAAFFSTLEDSCIKSDRFCDQEVIILGDFNANMFKPKESIVKAASHFSYLFNLKQLIKDATRVTPTSETCIDLVFVSDINKICQSGVITVGLSDHFINYCTRKTIKGQINKHKTIKIRSMKNYTTTIFHEKLSAVDWSEVFNSTSVEHAWSTFKKFFVAVLDDIAPFKQTRVKQRSEPWFDNELRCLVQERDRMLLKFRKTKDRSFYSQYKVLRNQVQYKIKRAKAKYYQDKIEDNSKNPKKLWGFLKDLGAGKSCSKKSCSIGLKVGDEVCFDKPTVAETFNQFFVTVAATLVNKLPSGSGKYGLNFVNDFYRKKGVQPNRFSLSQVEEDSVLKLLLKINTSKSTGLDNLPAKFLKDAAPIISKPLTHIINLSIEAGEVPNDMKNARVVPIYKKNSKTEAGNYRPVSILSVVSKIFERIMYDQLEKYIKDESLLYEFQSGFRPSFSTDTCLIHLSDFIRNEWDKGNYTGMVVLDLQKAFDTVDHTILLSKLEAMGMTENSVKWFDSYLTGRSQVVDIDGVHSGPKEITCGVPQGSILGPLLFLIYVNDMADAVKCKLLLYADDSALMVSHRDVDIIQKRLSDELEAVNGWLIDNKLSLHLGKTESILFGTKHKLARHSELNIKCGDTSITPKAEIRYLGLDLDQSLSGEVTGVKVIKKANSRLKFLYRRGSYLNLYTKKLLVSALIQCHYDYGCSIWYTPLSKQTKCKLQTTQNKIIRNVLCLPPRSHIGASEFHKINWLPVNLRVSQIMLNHMFRILNGKSPSYLEEGITKSHRVHRHNTRSGSMALFKPRMGTHGQKTFTYNAISLWNSLPQSIQIQQCKDVFKKEVKTHFLNQIQESEVNNFVYF